MRCLPSTVVLLLSVLLTNSSWAGEDSDAEGERKGRKGELRQKILDEFDADGDGRLSEDERATAREEMHDRRGQGRRGEGSRGEGRRDREGRKGRPGRRGEGDFDGPRDRGPEGRRGPDDRGAEGRNGPGGRRPPSPEEMFDRFDANEDGQLSRDEFRKLAGAAREMRDRIRGGQFGRDFGNRGPDDDRGFRGDRGPRGDRGFRGERGPQGDRGRFGPRGDDQRSFKRPERPQRPPLQLDPADDRALTEDPSN